MHRTRQLLPSISRKLQQQSTRRYITGESDFSLQALFTEKSGIDLLHDPLLNKGTAHPPAERDRLAIRGLMPPRVTNIDIQMERVMARYQKITDDIERYLFCLTLQDQNETLFYQLLMRNLKAFAPIIYTPTVGFACQKFGHLYRRPRGMYFSALDRGEMISMVYNWPVKDVDIIVVTDGGRVLGLGDLGANGMGIPIGKLSLYVAAGGIHPGRVLPICLDVGTDNEELRNDPFYLGLPRSRLTGDEYFAFIDEFITAVRARWPNCMIQFEDFTSNKAPVLLQKYRNTQLCFNDDIQGTGAVVLSGLLSSLRAAGKSFADLPKQKILLCGAGSAGIGVADGIINGMLRESATNPETQFYVVDRHGLITKARQSFGDGQEKYAREETDMEGMSILEVVQKVKPDILLGLSGQGGIFTEDIVREMAKHVPRPIIFALSNPTSRSECTAEQAYRWTNGRAIFASGSPFNEVTIDDQVYVTSQGNNMYIFPAIGLGSILAGAKKVSDEMFYAATKALSNSLSYDQLRRGMIYPNVEDIRPVTCQLAAEVVRQAVKEGLATKPIPVDVDNVPALREWVAGKMWVPRYQPIVTRTEV